FLKENPHKYEAFMNYIAANVNDVPVRSGDELVSAFFLMGDALLQQARTAQNLSAAFSAVNRIVFDLLRRLPKRQRDDLLVACFALQQEDLISLYILSDLKNQHGKQSRWRFGNGEETLLDAADMEKVEAMGLAKLRARVNQAGFSTAPDALS